MTKGCNRPVMGFYAHSLAVSLLIGVGRDHRPVLDAADLAGQLPYGLKQLLVAVVQNALLFLRRKRKQAPEVRRTHSWSSCWWRLPGLPNPH
jgi:hypothetical protein